MLDIGWTEMAFIAVIALVIIGPKDLPKALRTVAGYVRKARAMAREFQSGLDEIARDTELDEVKDQLTGAIDFDLKNEIEKTVDPTGEIDDAMNISDELSKLDAETPDVSHDLPEPPGSDFVPPAEDEPDEAEAAAEDKPGAAEADDAPAAAERNREASV